MRQMRALLSHIPEAFGTHGASVPVILMGDFNTEPRWDLIPALRRGDAEVVGEGQHAFSDAYANHAAEMPGYTDTPFTSFSWFLQGVADYVLHTEGLVATNVLKVPGIRDVVRLYNDDYPYREPGRPRFEMLPTASFPSDHLPLVVDFTFSP